MDNRIRHAFDQVRAEDTLKKDTEKYLEKATHGYGKRGFFARRLAVSFAGIAMAFVVAAGSYFYAVPAYAITLDAESSVELRVNRMDRVISVKGVNDNGRTLANSVKVFLMKYPDALETIMSNADIRKDLEEKKDISITVVGENDQKSEEMTDVISSCTYAHHPNITCMCGNREDVEAAQEAGLPLGKYRMFLEWKQYDPAITAEEISSMSMQEIREKLEEISGNKYPAGAGMNGNGMNGNGMNGAGMNGNGMNGAGMNGNGMNGTGRGNGKMNGMGGSRSHTGE
jgi:hypothetical protein